MKCKNSCELTFNGAVSGFPVPQSAVALFLEETSSVGTVHLTTQQIIQNTPLRTGTKLGLYLLYRETGLLILIYSVNMDFRERKLILVIE